MEPVGLSQPDAARPVVIEDRVRTARAEGRPVVALESTIFSELGLPAPANRQALERVVQALEAGGAVPALTAIIDGQPRVGLGLEHADTICGPTRKVAARDLGVAVAGHWSYGATTVSASVTLAAAAGLDVFATGGIGGVHRGWSTSADISADLPALARRPVVTVTAGAKVFLDLAATVEYLETMSVPVLGWRTDRFPAFHSPRSNVPLTTVVETVEEVAAVARAHWGFGGGGIVLAVPVPSEAGLDLKELEDLISQALDRVGDSGVSGPAVTPQVLDELAVLSEGRTVEANLALAENNASVAAGVAQALLD